MILLYIDKISFYVKYQVALNIIDHNGCKCFYIDGPGGSGKTFVYTTLYNLLKS